MGLSTYPLNHKGKTEELQTKNTQDAGLYVRLCSRLSRATCPRSSESLAGALSSQPKGLQQFLEGRLKYNTFPQL